MVTNINAQNKLPLDDNSLVLWLASLLSFGGIMSVALASKI